MNSQFRVFGMLHNMFLKHDGYDTLGSAAGG